jgi:hypothetical protein
MDDIATAKAEDILRKRLNMLTESSDTVVLVGMVAAGVIDASVLSESPDSAADQVSRIARDEFTRFQRLWYHFRVPHAKASLVWWRLFSLAVGRTGNVGKALEHMTAWLGQLDGDPHDVLRSAASLLDLSPGTVVITQEESDDIQALKEAVRLNVPMIAVSDVSETKRIADECGVTVLTSPAAAGTESDLWHGTPVGLKDISPQTRQKWEGLSEEERADLLGTLAQRVTSIEQLRLLVDETPLINREVAKILERCSLRPVSDWPENDLALVTALWAWQVGGFAIQELNQSFISLPALALFLGRRIREYSTSIGDGTPEQGFTGADMLDLAQLLAELRGQVEKQYERCLHFDGSNWERREFLLPSDPMWAEHKIPVDLAEKLYDSIGAEFPGGVASYDAWDTYVERALEAGSTPTRILQVIAQWSADASDLPIDIGVFTVPIGCKLDTPWTLDFTDLFCYCGFRSEFHPKDFGIATSLVGIQNIMGQRMRYNAVKKAQNYAPVRRFPPQGFNLPDISIAEDANHAGHSAAGVRLACRVPFPVTYRGRIWNGLADVRLNRADYSNENRFLPRDLITANRYAQWTRGVADAAYRRDLTFETKWGDKVTDLTL